MKTIPRRTSSIAGFLVLISAFGCGQAPDYRDQRLAEFAQKSVSEQAQQNARMSEVMKRDAEFRQELISTHQSLTKQLHQQQTIIDGHRDRLDNDRRELAQQRYRDPIIAAALQNSAIMMACLLPLLVALMGIWQMQHQEPDHAAIAELLVAELTSERPLFLPRPVFPRLAAPPEASRRQQPIDDSDHLSEPPF